MAKWTVALFGHQKFIPNQADDPVEYAAAIKRYAPGDLVAFKPWDGTVQWTPLERSEFLIVDIDNLEEVNIAALCETYYDLNTYPEFTPLSRGSWRSNLIQMWNNLTQAEKDLKLAWWNSLTQAQQDAIYDEYLQAYRDSCRFPTGHIKRRRFTLQLSDLQSLGVDTDRMLNRNELYDPRPLITKLDAFDRKNNRKVLSGDGLNMLAPLTDFDLPEPA